MSKGLGPLRRAGHTCSSEGQLPFAPLEGRARVARCSDFFFFFFSGEARDLTFFVFNLLIVEFVNISK